MSEPLQKNEDDQSLGMEAFKQVLYRLSVQFFVGRNAEILQGVLAGLTFHGRSDVLEAIVEFAKNDIATNASNITDMEAFNLEPLAQKIAAGLHIETPMDLTDAERTDFDDALKRYAHELLHNVAFPFIILESPHEAVAAKNMVKRSLNAVTPTDDPDVREVLNALDLENLPTEFSREHFYRLGGKIPGIDVDPVKDVTAPTRDPEQTVAFCELSHEQAIVLARMLHDDYGAIKNWRQLYYLLKSNGKKYDSVIVLDENKGIVLSVLNALKKRKNLAGAKYLWTSGNGVWPFFEGFLIDSKTGLPFKRELRKLCNESKYHAEAERIVEELLAANRQIYILERAKELFKTL